MSEKLGIALSAGFGGIAPNLFRVSADMTSGRGLPDVSYVIGVTLFALIGAATALSFGETDTKKAFFLGLGLPAMFQSAAQDVSTAAARLELEPVAFAAELGEDAARPVAFFWLDGELDPADFSAIYKSADDKRRLKDDFESPGSVVRTTAPVWCTGVQIVIGDVKTGPRSNWVEFEPGEMPLRFSIRVERRALVGFRQAIGLSGVDEYKVTLALYDEEVDGAKR